METSFSRWKRQSLERVDASRKGGVDRDIQDLLALINSCQNLFSTSSCSGRIILIDAAPGRGEVQKQNCVWLLVSHEKCSVDQLMSALSRSTGDAVLKFEPFVLHVQCRRLEDAQMMHSVAVNSGFRNSGLTVGRTGKIMAAVRSTHGLEVPLSHEGKLLVGRDYVHFLSQTANQKMEENLRRIHRFYQNLQSGLSAGTVHIPESPEPEMQETTTVRPEEDENSEERKNTAAVYKRRRRRQRQTDCYHGDGNGYDLEMDDGLDLFT